VDAIEGAKNINAEKIPGGEIHAGILSKINLNMNQKAGLSVNGKERPKNSFDATSKSPVGRSRSSTQGSKDGSQNGSLTLNTGGLGTYNPNVALSPALLALSMYNYVPTLSSKTGNYFYYIKFLWHLYIVYVHRLLFLIYLFRL
jgi:hypothetical protein